jgi:hypothetical protein
VPEERGQENEDINKIMLFGWLELLIQLHSREGYGGQVCSHDIFIDIIS